MDDRVINEIIGMGLVRFIEPIREELAASIEEFCRRCPHYPCGFPCPPVISIVHDRIGEYLARRAESN